MQQPTPGPVAGKAHWTRKGEVKLFLWQKPPPGGAATRGTVLFVHGSSMASQPTFDLTVPGRPDSSVMDEWHLLKPQQHRRMRRRG